MSTCKETLGCQSYHHINFVLALHDNLDCDEHVCACMYTVCHLFPMQWCKVYDQTFVETNLMSPILR